MPPATPNKLLVPLRSLGLQLALLIGACMIATISALGIHLANKQAEVSPALQ